MGRNDEPEQMTHWRALRLATELSQREVEKRLGWTTGHLSLIERGVLPTAERKAQLRKFYGELLSATFQGE